VRPHCMERIQRFGIDLAQLTRSLMEGD
jgi:hypothetical protein